MTMDALDIKYENDFQQLIIASVNIGNNLSGKVYDGRDNLIYAEGLSKKILNHILTIKNLMSGYSLVIKNAPYEPMIDFSSIFVLTRAAIETYLTLNYLFISPKDNGEREFRFLCWHLAGYLERSETYPQTDENKKKQLEERAAIEKIKGAIEQQPAYSLLSSKTRGDIMDGKWRLKSWNELAKDAGIGGDFFKQQYSFLCAYAHSSWLPVLQIQQTKTIEGQAEMSMSPMAILLVVLAKHMYDYINLIPELKKSIDQNSVEFLLISQWKSVGENWEGFFNRHIKTA